VIARLLPASHFSVHIGSDEAVGDRRAEQQMVDAQTRVALPSVPEEIPERIDLLARMQRAQRVGPALGGKEEKAARVVTVNGGAG
jgi:hypothetical protein